MHTAERISATTTTIRRKAAAVTLAVLSVAGAGAVQAGPAGAAQGSGNPNLTVNASTLSAGQASTVTVTGTDYLVPPHAAGTPVFGGVYLFFGWVAGGAWGPSNRNSTSNNGTFGTTYSSPGDGGDASTRDDGSGVVRLIAFTPGGVSGSETPFHMDDNGNWSTTLHIKGSTFTYVDPATKQTFTVNCQQVQCGVFTIGAHGKASATNEKFAPITFTGGAAVTPPTGTPGAGGGTRPSGSTGTGGTGSTGSTPAGGAAGTTAATTVPAADTTVVGSTTTGPEVEGKAATKAKGSADEPIALSPTSSVDSTSDGAAWVWIIGIPLVLAAAGAGIWWWLRSRRTAT